MSSTRTVDKVTADASTVTNLTKAQVGLSEVPNLKYNLVATVAPTANEDSNDGYAVGSRWCDVSAKKEYVCVKDTVGLAEWTETTSQGELDHTNLTNIGTNTHAQLDSHVANSAIHETITASNKTGDQGLFSAKVGTDLQFKSLKQGNNVTFSSDANAVTINSTAGLTWNGAWTSQDYVVNDAVSYNGAAYVCKLNTTASQNPSDGTYWDILAEKGAPGSNGADGTNGVDGAPGLAWQGAWVTATSYSNNDGVKHNGASYICTTGHTSGASSEPLVGGSWATYWDVLSEKGSSGANIDAQSAASAVMTSTTSSTYVDLNSASVTTSNTTATRYIMYFTATIQCSSANKTVSFILNVDGVDIAATGRRIFIKTLNSDHNIAVSCMAMDVTSGKIIKVRYKTDGGELSVYERSLEVYGIY